MMATPPLVDLLIEIQQALGLAASSNLSTSSQGDNVFEAYVFSRVLEAAQVEGATVLLINEPPTSQIFRLRTSPSHLWIGGYSYAYLTFPSVSEAPPLELHTGIYLTGKSKQIHEADVAVIDAAEAEFARDNSTPPRSTKSLLTIECKFLSGDVGIAMGRGFVGLCSDFGSRECFFVSNAGSSSVARLLTHHKKSWQHELEPSNTVVDTRFRNVIQDLFKDYKAKYA
jgi:hypothetical protein